MKIVLFILTAATVFASCSTAYKVGQTPDDVYYSPERPQQEAYVRMDDRDDRGYRYRGNDDRVSRYDDRFDYYDDRYLRMRVRNPRMWSDLDFYYNDPYAYNYYPNRYGMYMGFGAMNPFAYSYWNPYSTWNYYHNPYYTPYYGHIIVGNPKSPVYNRPRTFNLNMYNTDNKVPVNTPRSSRVLSNNRTYRNSNDSYNSSRDGYNSNRRSSGAELRESFGNSNNRQYNNNSSNSNSSRSYNNSSSSGSSSSGNTKSGGSAPARRF